MRRFYAVRGGASVGFGLRALGFSINSVGFRSFSAVFCDDVSWPCGMRKQQELLYV